MTARTTFADFQITVEDLVAAEDRVAGRITMRGTHRGALAGLPPTGKSVEFSGMFVRRLAGGQFVEDWGLTDLFGLLRQIGAIPMPG